MNELDSISGIGTPQNALSAAQTGRYENLAAWASDPQVRTNTAGVEKAVELFTMAFVEEMTKAMRQTIPDGGLIEKNAGEELFQSFLDTEYSRMLGPQLAEQGIAEALRRQLIPDDPANGTLAVALPGKQAPAVGEKERDRGDTGVPAVEKSASSE
jgi:Rod binding domain-containing protein